MKNKLILFTILVSLIIIFANCNLAFSEWKDLDKIKVAIIELTSRVPGENIDTATITDLLQAELIDQNAFKIVERTMIDKIFDEQKLQLSGLTNDQLVKIGELSGAQKIIIGSLSKLGDEYLILVKAIDISTGVVDFSEKISSESLKGLINKIPDLAATIVRKVKGEAEPKPKPNIVEVTNQAKNQEESDSQIIISNEKKDSQADISSIETILAPFLVTGDKIYSYPENDYCYVAQEFAVDSLKTVTDKYASLGFRLYNYYEEGWPDISLDISKYNRLHFELKADRESTFYMTLQQDDKHMNGISFNYSGNDFKSYNLVLASFEPWSTVKRADLSKLASFFINSAYVGQIRYTIRNIYFYNSKTKESYRISGLHYYTWKDINSLTIEASVKVIEAELDYDPDLNVTGLGVILNSNPHDYHSAISLNGYRNLIFDLKADTGDVHVTIDNGTSCLLTGVSNNKYSTYTIPLDKLTGSGLYLYNSRKLKLEPVTSNAGKLYVRNIRFE